MASMVWLTEPPPTRWAISHSVSLAVVLYSLPEMLFEAGADAAGRDAVAGALLGAAAGTTAGRGAGAATGSCGAAATVVCGEYSGGSSSSVYSRSRRPFGQSTSTRKLR